MIFRTEDNLYIVNSLCQRPGSVTVRGARAVRFSHRLRWFSATSLAMVYIVHRSGRRLYREVIQKAQDFITESSSSA